MRYEQLLLASASLAGAAIVHEPYEKRQDYGSFSQVFQTTPELYAGPTPTGSAPFLAQTNPAPFPSVSYIPPSPLETQVPIQGAPSDGNIYHLMGQLSHYFPNPDGFGVNEYPLPAGANITQLHMLSRHGARYPASTVSFVGKLRNNTYNATGDLDFLNGWKYKLGAQILVPIGQQELFDSGVLHQYQYGHLYNNNGSKIVARTTSEDRMLKSAEYFLAGFFGLGWTRNASIEVIIEEDYYNNSLAAYDACNNSNTGVSNGGANASAVWTGIYLADAASRLNKMITFSNSSINITASDAHDMQSLCAYETVALGFSKFCELFTYAEWEGYEYSVDLSFVGSNGFQSPTGRSVGIAYVQELRARLQQHYLTTNGGSANITLDSNPITFPLNQSLYFDFSHDTNIFNDLTAFGFTQFAQFLPETQMLTPREVIVSHMTPFGARLDIEVIQASQPVNARRSGDGITSQYCATGGGPTTYVHFILNQRTLPLHTSFPQCEYRDDGWCTLPAFLNATANAFELSQYDYSCNGNYSSVPYGTIKNGNPSVSQPASNSIPPSS